MNSITILIKEANKPLEKSTIPQGYEEMQKVVQGPMAVMTLHHGIDMWYNDEFLFHDGFEPNLVLNETIFHGPVFFSSADEEGQTISLTEEQEKIVARQLQNVLAAPYPIYVDLSLEDLVIVEKKIAYMNRKWEELLK